MGGLILLLLIWSHTVQISDLFLRPGEEGIVRIEAELGGIVSGQMAIQFDPSLLEHAELIPSHPFGTDEIPLLWSVSEGELKLAFASARPLEGRLEIAQVKLKLSEAARAGRSCRLTVTDPLLDESITPETYPGLVGTLLRKRIALSKGINLISLPLRPIPPMTAGELADLLGDDLIILVGPHPTTGRPTAYTGRMADEELSPERGYLLLMRAERELLIEGAPPEGFEVNLKRGPNLIAPPPSLIGRRVRELWEILGEEVIALIWRSPSTGRFVSFTPGSPSGEEVISEGMGFIALARSEVRRSLEPGDQGPVRGASQADAEGKADEEGLINSEGATRLEGRMIGVVDGDTVVVEIDGREETVRLLGVDAPELNPGGLPEPFALEAKGFLERFIGEPVELIISVDEDERRDKLGRLLAVIICDGRNLNASLLERGLAVRLFQRNEALNFGAWEKLEVEARRERRGIWSGMGSKGIVITELNPNPGSVRDSVGEFVELMNLNPFPVNLGGWRLQRPGKSLELPEEAVIPAGGFLILCRTDPDTFRSIYPDVPPEVPVIRIKGLSLLNRYSPPEGMAIWLRDEVGWYQDGLSYNLRWDERGADGTDRTLEKLFPELMNVGDSRVGGEDDANWSPGLNPMGTPGRPNSLPKPPPGDASLNGVLTAYDAALALRNELGLERLYSAQLKAGDINGDGAFDARDALEILRRVVGLR